MKHKTLRTLLCVILTVCFCLSAIAPVSAAGLFGGDSGAASIFDEWIRSLKDRFIEKNPGTDETPAEPLAGAGTNGFEYKIVFLDCGRKYFSVDSIKTIIDNAAAAGFNYVQLAVGNDGMRFLLDDMSLTVNGVTYSHNDVSAAIHAGNEAYYNFTTDELTQTEMDTIIAYAKEKGIGIIPCVNTPGHMDAILDAAEALTKTTCSYNGSGRTIDVTNDTAVAFTQAFVQKYINYFAGKGCNLFNMGADEYANDIYTSGSMGFGNLQSTGKYSDYVTYVNQLAKMIDAAGMTPMAFNDGIYFNNNTSSGTFDTNIIICYWSSGWSGYSPMSVATLASKGFKMVNTNGSYYWVLGKADAQCSAAKASGFNYKAFPGGTIDNPAGAMFCIWCDYPGAETEESTLTKTAATIAAFGGALPKDTPTISGIKDGDSLTIGSSVTLSVSGGADATWTSSDTEVLNLEAVTGDAVAAAVGTVTAKSVKATALKKGSATVTVATADGKTASATIQVYSETDPVTKNIELVIGEEKTDIQAGDVTGQVGDYDNSIVTITTAHQTIDGTPETSVAKIAMSSYGQYTGVISDGTNYMVVDSNGIITNTDKAENATEFVVTYSTRSGYTIKTKDSTYNLNVSVGGRDYNPTFTLVAAESSATNWSYSNGFNYRYETSFYDSYYICYLNGSWTVRNNWYSDFTASHLYKVTTTTTEPVNQTTITFKGKAVGTTSVTIGGVLYNINVTKENLNTVTPLTVEYWITNRPTYNDAGTANQQVSATLANVNSEDGVEFTTIVPSVTTENIDDTGTKYYIWKGTRLTSGNKQTATDGVDQTAAGNDFFYIRYWNGVWSFSANRVEWTKFNSNDQIVAYYLQKTDVTKEVETYVKDWGYGTDSTTPNTSSGEGQVALTIAVVYPDGSVSPTEANMYSQSTTIFNYWNNRDIGIIAPKDNGDYNIAKITVTDGTRKSNTTANQWYTSDTITWYEKTLDDGTKWYNETEVWNKSSGTTPMVNGKNSNITWSAKNTGKLVLIYLEVIQKETNLNVVYWDNHADAQINPNPIQVAVEDGVTYLDPVKGLKNVNPLQVGQIVLPDNAYITNSSGVNQTFSKDLGNMSGVPSGYTSGLYEYTYAEISQDGKTLTLFYDISTTKYKKEYVVDYGMPITISGLASWLGVKTDAVKLSVAKGYIAQDRQGLYGRAIIDTTTQDTLTYEINKPLNATAVIPIYVYPNDNPDPTNAVLRGTVSVIPATNVYYEETVLTSGKDNANGSTSWTSGGTATASNQALEVAGTNTHVHGFDPIYNTQTTFSRGGYMTATMAKPTTAYGALTNDYLSFTFNGTGYDVVSECGPNTGMLWVERWLGNQCKKITIVDTSFYGDNTFVTGGDGVLAYQIPVVRELDLTRDKYEIRIYGYSLATAGAFTGGQNNTNAAEASRYSLAPVADTFAMEDDSFYSILAAHGIDMDEVEVEFTSMQNNSEVAVYAATAKAAKLDAVAEVQYDSSTATTSTATTSVVYVDAFRVYQPIADESKYDAVETGMKYASVYKYVKNGQEVDNDIDSAVYVEYDGDQTVERITSIDDYKRGGPQNEVYLTSSTTVKNYVGMILYNWSESSHIMVSAKAIAGNPVLSTQTGKTYLSTTIKTSTEMYYDVTKYVEYDATLGEYILILGNGSAANSVLSVSTLKVSSGVEAAASQNLAKRMAFYVVENQVEATFEPRKFQVSESTNAFAGDVITVAVQATDDVDKFVVYSDASLTSVVSYVADPYWSNKRAYNKGKTDVKNYLAYFAAPTEPGEYTYYMAAFDTNGKRSAPVKVFVTVTE